MFELNNHMPQRAPDTILERAREMPPKEEVLENEYSCSGEKSSRAQHR
jgi:hypothetical protein